MNKKNIILLVFAIILLIIAIAIFIFANSQSTNKDISTNTEISNATNQNIETEKTTEPEEFTFADKENNQYKISDFTNKPMAIIFWSSDSENSLTILEMVDKHYNDYKDSINFLLINTNEPNSDIKNIMNKIKFESNLPIYYDLNSSAVDYYFFEKLPTLVFIESDGTISKQTEENITEDAFLANLDIIAHNY